MVGLLNESSEGIMDKLDNELGDIVDRQLRDLGFISLCSRIANKLVKKVQQIDDDHHIVKRTIDDIEQQLNLFLSDKDNSERGPELIVIDDEEESPRDISSSNAEKNQQSDNINKDKRGTSFGKDGPSVSTYPAEITPRTQIVSARTSVFPRSSFSLPPHSRTSLGSFQPQTPSRSSLSSSAGSNTATVSSVPAKTFHTQPPQLISRLTPGSTTINKTNNIIVSSSTLSSSGRMLPQERPQSVFSTASSSFAQVGSKRTALGKPLTNETSPNKPGITLTPLGKTFTSSTSSEKKLLPLTTAEKQTADKSNTKTTPTKSSSFSSSGFRAFTTASSPKSSVVITSTSPLAKKKTLPAASQALGGNVPFSYASSVPNYSSYWPQTPTVPVLKKHTGGTVSKPVGVPSVASAGTQTIGSSLRMKRPDGRMYSIGNVTSMTAPHPGSIQRPILHKPHVCAGAFSYPSSAVKPLANSVSLYTSTSPPTEIMSPSEILSALHTESDNDTGSASETTAQPEIEDEISEMFESDELEYTKAKRIEKFLEGMQVLAKPEKSDIWYQGNIIKTYLTKNGQEKFHIKFGSSQKLGNLTVNHLAPLSHPVPKELHVGSRVVAGRPSDTVDDRLRNKYKEISTGTKTDILFGGIVAEIACEDTRNRYLIFFDDGFAAYCSLKKLHLVIFASIKVWEDVAIHCREFVKEYLEEYPDRPMVKLKTGQIVNTEWNGRWLKARVLSVDGSLVKMLFDIDRRSEWIYRGSTRLEPLYTELDRRDREQAAAVIKSKGKTKRRKPGRSKKEPCIEDMITKPCFGISRLSKTDPEGIQQNKEWEAEFQMKAKEDLENAANDDNSSVEKEEFKADVEPNEIEDDISVASLQSQTNKEQLNNGSKIEKESEDVKEDNAKTKENTNFYCEIERKSPPPVPSTSIEDSIALSKKPGRYSRQSSTSSRSSTPTLSKSSTAPHPKITPSAASPLPASSSPLLVSKSQLPSSVVLPSAEIPLLSIDSPLPQGGSQDPDSDSSSSHSLSTSSKVTKDEPKFEAKPSVMPFSGSLEGAEENWEAPWLKRKRRPPSQSRDKIKIPPPDEEKKCEVRLNEQKGIASRLQEKLQQQVTLKADTLESPTKDVEQMLLIAQTFPRIRGPHKCSSTCVPDSRIPTHEIGKHNILSIPLLLGWTRETAKRRPGYRRDIYYRTPCNRRLRNMLEVTQYLLETKTTNVTIDQFTFDPSISCRDQSPILKPRAKIDDLSHGKEKVPIQCVNEKNSQYPPVVEYISRLIVADGIKINFDPGYLACCDCTDFCQDKVKCSCQRLTVASSDAIDGQEDESACYEYRKLKDCITTGLYECNQNCSCGPSCFNRIVQHGIRLRLQVFMTESKGWGLRCVDDIPRGSFVCTYVGQILNEDMANREGTDFGDEYLAELDHIEVVEQAKEGYESDVPELRDERNSNSSVSTREGADDINSKGDESESDDSEYSYSTITSSSASEDDDDAPNQKKPKIAPLLLRRQKSANSSGESETITQHDETWCAITKASKSESKSELNSSTLIDLTLDSSETDDEDDDKTESAKIQSSLEVMIAKLKSRVKEEKDKPISGLLVNPTTHRIRQEDTAEGGSADDPTGQPIKKRRISENIDSDSESNEDGPNSLARQLTVQLLKVKLLDQKGQGSSGQAVPRQNAPFRAVARKTTKSALQRNMTSTPGLKGSKAVKPRAFAYKSTGGLGFKTAGILGLSGRTFTSPRISTGGHFARKAMAARFQAALQGTPSSHPIPVEEKEITPEKKGTRNLYGERNCYVVDAKSFGNVGRYLNHSCSPNLFVQNVFIETHDLRFPVVAFFAQQNVPALTELTWDYSYDVGSVPGKELQCHCGSSECRGRLL